MLYKVLNEIKFYILHIIRLAEMCEAIKRAFRRKIYYTLWPLIIKVRQAGTVIPSAPKAYTYRNVIY